MLQTLERTSVEGAVFAGKFVAWGTLTAAANQEDKSLAGLYSDLLDRAKKAEAKRLIAENWKEFGYPIRTGFGRQYAGQHLMRAWEIRSFSRPGGVKSIVAYIVTWDRSINEITRMSSPKFAEYDLALDWVGKHYGGWHDELGGQRTANIWLRA